MLGDHAELEQARRYVADRRTHGARPDEIITDLRAAGWSDAMIGSLLPRPGYVTVIGWWLVAASVATAASPLLLIIASEHLGDDWWYNYALSWGPTSNRRLAAFALAWSGWLPTLASAVAMLSGKGWGRWLYVWSPLGLGIAAIFLAGHFASTGLLHALLWGIVVMGLWGEEASAFFGWHSALRRRRG